MLLFRSKVVTCRLSPLSPAFASSSIYLSRLFSPSPAAARAPASDFAVQYLIKSCGLPSDKAAKASRYLPHLKSPHKPDAVLQFLRQAGVSEPHIKAAASRDPQLLCRSVEKCLQPRIAQLKEIGFSPSHISLLISINPHAFGYTKLQQNILFWLGIFNSIEELLAVLKGDIFLLGSSHKRTSANLSFLQDQCGFSACQIAHLIKLAPRLITSMPQALKNNAKRAEQLGVRCSSRMFVHALRVVNSLNQSIVDARINNLRSLGFSQEEVTNLVSKQPSVLTMSEDITARKMEFLTKKAGCDKKHLVNNPVLLSCSMEKRLIPRSLVRKVLKVKGFPVANRKIASFMIPSEKKFVEKFVLPYEPTILGFLQAYEDARAGNIGGLEFFTSNSS